MARSGRGGAAGTAGRPASCAAGRRASGSSGRGVRDHPANATSLRATRRSVDSPERERAELDRTGSGLGVVHLTERPPTSGWSARSTRTPTSRRAAGLRRRRRHGRPRRRRRGQPRSWSRSSRGSPTTATTAPAAPRSSATCLAASQRRIQEYAAENRGAGEPDWYAGTTVVAALLGEDDGRPEVAARQPRRLAHLPRQRRTCSTRSASTTAWSRSWSTPARSTRPRPPSTRSGT